jgi:hypothetical protein
MIINFIISDVKLFYKGSFPQMIMITIMDSFMMISNDQIKLLCYMQIIFSFIDYYVLNGVELI